MNLQLGLIGYPLGHSLSPKIHKAALGSCDLKGDYSLFPIYPEDRQKLKDVLARVRTGELTGLNVTVPHKQNVIPLLDELTVTAKTIGAVNTISLKNSQLIGDNTDAPGFLVDLRKFLSRRTHSHGDKKSALVLGAGGSARAVIYALANDGWTVTVAARRLEQARELIAQISLLDIRISCLEYRPTYLQPLLPDLSLIVHATPVGMSPENETSPWPASLPFPLYAAVYDLVYNPLETKLVKDARAAGLHATTGLGMLIEQAALAFEIWTGCTPPRDALNVTTH